MEKKDQTFKANEKNLESIIPTKDYKMYAGAIKWALDRIYFSDMEPIEAKDKPNISLLNQLLSHFERLIYDQV